MRDLNRRNEFAWKTGTGRYIRIEYSEARARLKRNQYVYERILPDHSYTPREKAQIPWTLIELDDETA
jgi:hypothetical protein